MKPRRNWALIAPLVALVTAVVAGLMAGAHALGRRRQVKRAWLPKGSAS